MSDAHVLTTGGNRFESVMQRPAVRARRRGKYLFVEFENDVVVFHFRMTGQITREDSPDVKFTRAAWRVGDVWLCFRDARRLGHIDVFTASEFLDYAPIAKMGPEPDDLDGPLLRSRVGGRALKAALMDQGVVAGVGNIAVSEVFWRQGISPQATGADLDETAWSGLATALKTFFAEVVAGDDGEAITYVNQGGENPFDVYGREGQPCPRCGHQIARVKVSGRSSYFCPACQAA